MVLILCVCSAFRPDDCEDKRLWSVLHVGELWSSKGLDFIYCIMVCCVKKCDLLLPKSLIWTVSTRKKTIDIIWILGLLTWPFGATRLVTWHYVLFACRRTLLQNECFRKNFPPWGINWKGYYRNHWTVTILWLLILLCVVYGDGTTISKRCSMLKWNVYSLCLYVRQPHSTLNTVFVWNAKQLSFTVLNVVSIALDAPHSIHHHTWKLITCRPWLRDSIVKTLHVRQFHNFLISSRFTRNNRFIQCYLFKTLRVRQSDNF